MATVSGTMFNMGVVFTVTGAALALGPFAYKAYVITKRRKLMLSGKTVLADVNKVVINYSMKLKGYGAWNTSTGQSPYQIVATWTDPDSHKKYEFISQNIWENPSQHLPSQVEMYIHKRYPEKLYYMNVNFLAKSFLVLPRSSFKSNLIWIVFLGFMLYQFVKMMSIF